MAKRASSFCSHLSRLLLRPRPPCICCAACVRSAAAVASEDSLHTMGGKRRGLVPARPEGRSVTTSPLPCASQSRQSSSLPVSTHRCVSASAWGGRQGKCLWSGSAGGAALAATGAAAGMAGEGAGRVPLARREPLLETSERHSPHGRRRQTPPAAEATQERVGRCGGGGDGRSERPRGAALTSPTEGSLLALRSREADHGQWSLRRPPVNEASSQRQSRRSRSWSRTRRDHEATAR